MGGKQKRLVSLSFDFLDSKIVLAPTPQLDLCGPLWDLNESPVRVEL
jgi:hypothetical protein